MKRRGTEQRIPPNPGYRSTLDSVICTLDLLEFPDLYLGFAIGKVAWRKALNLAVLSLWGNAKAEYRTRNSAKPKVQISAEFSDLYPGFAGIPWSVPWFCVRKCGWARDTKFGRFVNSGKCKSQAQIRESGQTKGTDQCLLGWSVPCVFPSFFDLYLGFVFATPKYKAPNKEI
jgi:hypothetical protein